MGTIHFVDTTLRDGNQSLWDATGLTTKMIQSLASEIDRVGFKAVDFISSIHMGVSVKYHREDPWEKTRLITGAMPGTPLSFGTTGRRFIGFKRCPDSIIALVYKRMVANGIRRAWLVDAAHELDLIFKNARMAKEGGIEEFVVALSYTISPVHTDKYYADMAHQITRCKDVDTVYIKDQGGLLTPERIKTLVPAVQSNLNGKPLELHSHCNTGLATQVYLDAVQLGVDIVHTGIPPLAEGTSQPSVFDILEGIEAAGFSPGIDAQPLEGISKQLLRIAEEGNRPVGKKSSFDPSYYEHQVPGGMVSTLKRQLAEAGAENKLPEVFQEILRVRKDLGFPIMVTPLSQFVGTQASMNVITGERYKIIPDGVMEYVLGYFGEPPGEIDPNVLERINKLPKAAKLRDREFPQPTVEEIREELGLGKEVTDEEFLLRYALGNKDVDAMLGDSPTA